METIKLLSRAKVMEVSGTATSVVNTYNENPIADDALLETAINELKAANDELLLAIEKDRNLSELDEVDAERDEVFRTLNNYVKGMLYNPISAARETAEALHAVLEKYQGIDRLPYTEETAAIRSFLLDWDSLGVDSAEEYQKLYAALLATQNNFEKAYAAYVDTKNESQKSESATKIKPAVLEKLNNRLQVYLHSASEFSPEKYGDFTNKVNIIVDTTNDNVRARRKS